MTDEPEKPKKKKRPPPSPAQLAVREKFKQNRHPPFEKGNKLGIKAAEARKGKKNPKTILLDLMGNTLLDKNGNPIPNPFDLNDTEMDVGTAIQVNILKAALGNGKTAVSAYNAIMDRAHGKLTEKRELTGADGEPLAVAIIDDI